MAVDPAVPTALTVLVPVRDEQERLPGSLERLTAFSLQHGDCEVLVVVDAESHDRTAAIARAAAESNAAIRVSHGDQPGKGSTVAAGVREARGRIVLMADVDLAVDPADFYTLERRASEGALAIASRSIEGSERVGEPSSRYLIGRAFNAAVRTLVLPGVRDTQCGFKAFPRPAGLSLFADLLTKKWVFDVEVLARARRAGLPIVEIPVRWTYHSDSRLRALHDAPDIVRELIRVRRAYGRVRDPGSQGG